MSVPVVWVAPDLSSVRLHAPSGGAQWRAPEPTEDDAIGVGLWTRRAQEAAAWLAQQRAVKRRLGALVIDPGESVCLWVRSSSLAPPVLSVSVSRLTEEWGDAASMWSVEPVYEAPRDPEMGADHALSAVCHHDAIVRLFLDALDRRGIVPGCVLSGWHALTHHAQRESGAACVIVHEPESKRLVWSWTDGDALLAGGTVAIGALDNEHAGAVARAALQRAAMDWMTWSSQLGTTPERAVVIGPGAETLGEAWGASFPDRAVRTQRCDDPRGETLALVAQRVDERGAAEMVRSTRTCLGRISTRPTRKVRKRYQIAAAAALLAGVAIGSVAVRLGSLKAEFRTRAERARADTRTLVDETWPGGIEGRPTSLVREAARLYQDEVNSTDIKLPPAPVPLFDETRRVFAMLNDVVESTRDDAPEELREGWAIRVREVTFDSTTLKLALQVPQREIATMVSVRLNDEGALASWERRGIGSGGNNATLPVYIGNWQKQQP